MRSFAYCVLFFVVSAIVFPFRSFSQETDFGARKTTIPIKQSMIGAIGSINFSFHNGTISTKDEHYPCCSFLDGNGTGFSTGAMMFLPLSDALSASPRISYEQVTGEFSNTQVSYPILGNNNTVEYVTLNNELNVVLNIITIDAMLTYDILPFGIYIVAGPTMGIIYSSRFKQIEKIIKDAEYEYVNGRASTILFDRNLYITNSLVFSLRGGAGVSIPITKSFRVNSEALYNLSLSNIGKEGNWNANRLLLNIGILVGF